MFFQAVLACIYRYTLWHTIVVSNIHTIYFDSGVNTEREYCFSPQRNTSRLRPMTGVGWAVQNMRASKRIAAVFLATNTKSAKWTLIHTRTWRPVSHCALVYLPLVGRDVVGMSAYAAVEGAPV